MSSSEKTRCHASVPWRGGERMGCLLSRRSALLGLAGLATTTRMSTARAAEKLRVGKSVAENWGNVPLNIGTNFGLFDNEGLEIEELVFAGGAKLAQALTAGEVDIGLSGGPDMA